MIEFAMVLPVLVLLLLGGVEMSRYLLLNQKLNRLATSTGDLVSRAETMSVDELDQIFQAAQYTTRPFALGDDGVVVVSSIAKQPDEPARVVWQQSGAGDAAADSAVGAVGQVATLPGTFALRDDQDIIVTEVFFDYTPLFVGTVTSSKQIYYAAISRPRFGSLDELEGQ